MKLKLLFIFRLVPLQSLFLLSSFVCFSQTKVRYGDLDNSRISVAEFIGQRKLNIPENQKLDSAGIIFSGAGFQNIIQFDFYPGFDSAKFEQLKALLQPGAAVTFRVKLINKYGQDTRYDFTYYFYSFEKKNIVFEPPIEMKRFQIISNYRYLSGLVFFSGENFSNVITVDIERSDIRSLKLMFGRCGPGTNVTFSNVRCEDEKNNILLLNETIKL